MAGSDGDSLTARLAHELSVATFTSRDHAKAKECVIDLLSCAFAAHELAWSRQARTLIDADTNGRCRIIGSTARAPISDAVFVNAVLCHGLVRDDMHLGSVSHLGAMVIPTVLGLAETRRITGRGLLDAIIGGYEAGGRLGRAVLDVDVARIHRPSGITGPFAAAAAGGLALRLKPEALATALALAANTAAGYNEWAATGGSEMYFHAGFAARNALTAIRLAEAGAYCSPSALEGHAGLLAAFGKRTTAAGWLQAPTTAAEIQSVFFKEVPACNYAQSPAQAACALARTHTVEDRAISKVIARVPYASAHYPGCDVAGPFAHVLQAKMSIQYNVAAALLRGNFDESNYDPADHPDVVALAGKVAVEIDDALTRAYPERQAATVVVELAGGRRLEQSVANVAPASSELVRERFLAAAATRLGRRPAARLLDFIETIETSDDVSTLLTLSQPEPTNGS